MRSSRQVEEHSCGSSWIVAFARQPQSNPRRVDRAYSAMRWVRAMFGLVGSQSQRSCWVVGARQAVRNQRRRGPLEDKLQRMRKPLVGELVAMHHLAKPLVLGAVLVGVLVRPILRWLRALGNLVWGYPKAR